MDLSELDQELRMMLVNNLTEEGQEVFPWIRALPTVEYKELLIHLLTRAALTEDSQLTRLLVLLGTTAAEMTTAELARWAPVIVLARNETLAARQPLPDSNQE